MNHVRIGLIGAGNIGTAHAKYLRDGRVRRAELAAVSDCEPSRLKPYADLPTFDKSEDLIRSGQVDAVLIATPHYSHTTIGIDALQQGLHVLVEKPLSAHKADAERLLAAHVRSDQVFAVMFSQRPLPQYRKLKRLVAGGELGELHRVSWIITDWFRPDIYYASSGWRATWAGEGGGVLLNQSPHQLDMLQWICGMPARVRGFCGLGKYHRIEVEDDVTAYLEYPNGATGVFITTTGEAPGTNRFEIAGERGRVVVENGKLEFIRNEMAVSEFSKQTRDPFSKPDVWHVDIPIEPGGAQHQAITQNFVDAILDGAPLFAPASDGIHSLELANAILYSSAIGATVELPLDGAAFEDYLKSLIAGSRFTKATEDVGPVDMAKSYGH